MIMLGFDYIRTIRVNSFTTILMLIVTVHAGAYGMGIYAIMLPSGVFSVAHCKSTLLYLSPGHQSIAAWPSMSKKHSKRSINS